jgi:hypothetical protein
MRWDWLMRRDYPWGKEWLVVIMMLRMPVITMPVRPIVWSIIKRLIKRFVEDNRWCGFIDTNLGGTTSEQNQS